MGRVNTTEERLELTAVDKATRVIQGVSGSVGALKKEYVGLTATVAAAFAGSFLADAARYRANLQDIADTTGDNVRTLDALSRQYRITRGDSEGLQSALTKLATNLNNTEEEGRGAAQALKSLGLNVAEIQAMKPGEAMFAIAEALSKWADGDAKIAASRALFGKEGPAQLKVLKDLAEAGEGQGRITAEQAAQAEQLEKNWRRLTMAFSDGKSELASGIIPYLSQMTEQMREIIRLGGGVGGAIRLAFSLGPVSPDMVGGKITETQAELERWQNSGPVGKFFRKPLGATYAGTEGDLQRQLEFLKFLERQNAMQGVGEGSLDARDLAARQKPLLDFKPVTSKEGREERDKSAQEYAASLQKQNEILDEANKLGAEFLLQQQKKKDAIDEQAEAVRALINPSRLYNTEQERLNKLVEQNAISQDEANQALRKWFEAKNGIKDLGEAAGTAAEAGHAMGLSFTSSIERVIFDTGRAVNAMDILRAAAMDVAKVIYGRNVAEPIAGLVQSGITSLFKPSGLESWWNQDYGTGMQPGVDYGFADGGVMTPHGAMPLRKYARGGIADSPQLAMFGEGSMNEAYVPLPDGRSIPVSMRGGGGTVFINAPGSDRIGLARLGAMLRAQGAQVEERAFAGMERRAYTRGQRVR